MYYQLQDYQKASDNYNQAINKYSNFSKAYYILVKKIIQITLKLLL